MQNDEKPPPALNIRNFPPDLLRDLKVQAAKEVKTLRELVIEKLKQ